MGVKTISSHSKYLGLAIVFGRSNRDIFALVIDSVWKKIKGWKERFLSRAGKEVLIIVVVHVIPTYIMSYYKLPGITCHEIESLLENVWWGEKNGERKFYWMSWDKLARVKGEGGLGFHGIRDFNTSLLGKNYCRLLIGENSFLGKVFKGR